MEFGVIGGRLGARRVGGLGGCCDPGGVSGLRAGCPQSPGGLRAGLLLPGPVPRQAGFEPA